VPSNRDLKGISYFGKFKFDSDSDVIVVTVEPEPGGIVWVQLEVSSAVRRLALVNQTPPKQEANIWDSESLLAKINSESFIRIIDSISDVSIMFLSC
jgi:hypothetical protein